ncbi:hypothetical protein Tco_0348620 [Tanacetum coccineum]
MWVSKSFLASVSSFSALVMDDALSLKFELLMLLKILLDNLHIKEDRIEDLRTVAWQEGKPDWANKGPPIASDYNCPNDVPFFEEGEGSSSSNYEDHAWKKLKLANEQEIYEIKSEAKLLMMAIVQQSVEMDTWEIKEKLAEMGTNTSDEVKKEVKDISFKGALVIGSEVADGYGGENLPQTDNILMYLNSEDISACIGSRESTNNKRTGSDWDRRSISI